MTECCWRDFLDSGISPESPAPQREGNQALPQRSTRLGCWGDQAPFTRKRMCEGLRRTNQEASGLCCCSWAAAEPLQVRSLRVAYSGGTPHPRVLRPNSCPGKHHGEPVRPPFRVQGQCASVRGLRVTLGGTADPSYCLSLGVVRFRRASGPGVTHPVWLRPLSLHQQDPRAWDRARPGSAAQVVHDQAAGRGAGFRPRLGFTGCIGGAEVSFPVFLHLEMSDSWLED